MFIRFADMPRQEKLALEKLGITDDSEGFNVTDCDRWEWISSTGNLSLITERVDIITLSTAYDDWFFCRLKFENFDDYVYINDASMSADTLTLGGIGSNSPHDAINLLKRIISYEDSRIPESITLHCDIIKDPMDIIQLYSELQYYIDNQDDLKFAVNNCIFY